MLWIFVYEEGIQAKPLWSNSHGREKQKEIFFSDEIISIEYSSVVPKDARWRWIGVSAFALLVPKVITLSPSLVFFFFFFFKQRNSRHRCILFLIDWWLLYDFCRALLQCVLCPSTLGNHRESIYRVWYSTMEMLSFKHQAVSVGKKVSLALKRKLWKCIGILLKPDWSILSCFRDLGCVLCF